MTQPGCKTALHVLVSRIKIAANHAGIRSVRAMSKASGVSKSGVDKIYNLKSYPTFDTLLAMAAACDTTVDFWTENLEQRPEAKGQKPEKAPKPEPSKPEPIKPALEPAQAAEPASNEVVDVLALIKGMNP